MTDVPRIVARLKQWAIVEKFAEAARLLESLEWSKWLQHSDVNNHTGQVSYWSEGPCCPFCYGHRDASVAVPMEKWGHRADCPLVKLLGREPNKPVPDNDGGEYEAWARGYQEGERIRLELEAKAGRMREGPWRDLWEMQKK